MLSRKHAWFGLVGLALCLTDGCVGTSHQRPAARARDGGAPAAAVPAPPTPLPPSSANAQVTAPVPPAPPAPVAPPSSAPLPNAAVPPAPTLPPTVQAVSPVAPPPTSPSEAPTANAVPPAAPTAPTVPVDRLARLNELHRLATERYATVDCYIAQLRRREQVRGEDHAEELLLFKFRKQPYSVYFKWIGPEGQGREVVYVQGQHGNQLHTLLAAGDMFPLPAGRRIALAPDNPFVLAKSRHAITEAGIGSLIYQFGELVHPHKSAKTSALEYLGAVQRPEFPKPLEMVQQQIPPGAEPQLAEGGQRLWGFDPDYHLPILIITRDHKGHEVEYYCYISLQAPVVLGDDDFNPDKLWRSPR